MSEPRQLRISRELFLGALGSHLGHDEPWVTERLAGLIEEDSLRAGDVLFRAGDPPDHYYFIRTGKVELVRDGHPPWRFEGRAVFGMSDALVERPRQRTATAMSDVALMRVDAAGWIELLEDSFELARLAFLAAARAVARLEETALATGLALPSAGPPPAERDGPLDVVERLAALTDVPILRGAGVQPLTDLAAACDESVLERGEMLFSPGAVPQRAFVIVDGQVEASRSDPLAVWRGEAGRIVCDAAALTGLPMPWTARATTRTRVLSFRLEDWFDLLEEHFEVVRSTLGALLLERERLLDQAA